MPPHRPKSPCCWCQLTHQQRQSLRRSADALEFDDVQALATAINLLAAAIRIPRTRHQPNSKPTPNRVSWGSTFPDQTGTVP